MAIEQATARKRAMSEPDAKLLKLLNEYEYPEEWAVEIHELFRKAELHDATAISLYEKIKRSSAENSKAIKALRAAANARSADMTRFLLRKGVDLSELATEFEAYITTERQRQAAVKPFFEVGMVGHPKSMLGRQRDFVIEGMIQRHLEKRGQLPAVNPAASRADRDEETDVDGRPTPQPFVQFLIEMFAIIKGEGRWQDGMETAARDVLRNYPSGTRGEGRGPQLVELAQQ